MRAFGGASDIRNRLERTGAAANDNDPRARSGPRSASGPAAGGSGAGGACGACGSRASRGASGRDASGSCYGAAPRPGLPAARRLPHSASGHDSGRSGSTSWAAGAANGARCDRAASGPGSDSGSLDNCTGCTGCPGSTGGTSTSCARGSGPDPGSLRDLARAPSGTSGRSSGPACTTAPSVLDVRSRRSPPGPGLPTTAPGEHGPSTRSTGSASSGFLGRPSRSWSGDWCADRWRRRIHRWPPARARRRPGRRSERVRGSIETCPRTGSADGNHEPSQHNAEHRLGRSHAHSRNRLPRLAVSLDRRRTRHSHASLPSRAGIVVWVSHQPGLRFAARAGIVDGGLLRR